MDRPSSVTGHTDTPKSAEMDRFSQEPMEERAVESLLCPESIAVVGASPDSWYASNLIENLLEYGYDNEIYYINPSRTEVYGKRCYDSITDLPATVDLAVVSVPRQYVIETVRDAGEMGVPSALVITAGFAEADSEGKRLENELEAVGEEYGMAICGPNTIGFANTHDDTVVTSTCSRKPGKGSIGLVSQSGALAFTTFYERATDEDLDFAYIVATGNEAGLSITDYVEYMATDERVDVICAYIEGIDEPRRFMNVAADAIQRGTPVLVTKVGRSAIAERATLSHTGSVTGDNAAWDAAFRQSGIERTPDIPDLLHRSAAHTAFDPPDSDRVCIASTSGGLASLLADMATERDLTLPDIDGATERTLLDMEDLLTFGELHNPADIRGYGADSLPEIAKVLFADDGFDAYVFAIGLPAVGERAERIADDVLTVREMADDPILFLWTGRKQEEPGEQSPAPYERVRRETPLYYDPGNCLDALASLVRFGEHSCEPSMDTDRIPLEPSAFSGGRPVPENSLLTWSESVDLLSAVGVDPVETHLATSPEMAHNDAKTFGDTVVLKIDSRDIPHRSDAGAVAVGIGPNEVAKWYSELYENAEEYALDAEIEGLLVQERVENDLTTEVLIGISTDESFGPVITVAPGGEFVELFGADAGTTLIPPVEKNTAREAIESTTLGTLLDGYRGNPPGDLDALATLVSRISRLAVSASDPPITELDLNPVFVNPAGDGVSIVDVLVRTGSDQ